MSEEYNTYGINNPDWRDDDEDMLNTLVRLESGFMAKQYDVLLAVEHLNKHLNLDEVTSIRIEMFCCAITGP